MQVFVNPGSGNVATGTREQSKINIKKFIEDLGVKAKHRFLSVGDDGRHNYKIWNDDGSHEVSMPAIPLEKVRYLNQADQNIWHFPRLYVDGSSWVWSYALGSCFQKED